MRALRGALAVAYPFLVFAGLHWFEPRHVALALAGALGLRFAFAARRPRRAQLVELALAGPRRAQLVELALAGLCVAAVLLPTLAWNDPRALLFVPVAVNLALLVAFARTLRGGVPLVETLARLQESELSPAQQRHCRSVTAMWSVFFALNAAACLALAVSGEVWLWTLYTGFVSYLVMALLYGGELLVRSWRFHGFRSALADPVLRRLFPAGRST